MSFEVLNKRVSHFGWIYLVSNLRRCIIYINCIKIVSYRIVILFRWHPTYNRHNNLLDGDILVGIIRHELYAADAAEETLDVLFSYSLPLLKSAGTSCEGCDIKSMLSNCGLSLSHMAVEGINIFLYFGNNTTE